MPNLAALRAAVLTLSGKNLKGGGRISAPPVGARVNIANFIQTSIIHTNLGPQPCTLTDGGVSWLHRIIIYTSHHHELRCTSTYLVIWLSSILFWRLSSFWLSECWIFVSWHFYPFDFASFWLFAVDFLSFCLFWLLTCRLLTLCPFDSYLSNCIHFDFWAVDLLPFWLVIFCLFVRFGFLSVYFSLSGPFVCWFLRFLTSSFWQNVCWLNIVYFRHASFCPETLRNYAPWGGGGAESAPPLLSQLP